MPDRQEHCSANAVSLPVQEAYDRWSVSYDSYDNPMVFIATHALSTGLAAMARGKRIFEFGCGTGRNLALLKQGGASALAGCDFSEGMLSVARRRKLGADLLLHDISEPLPDGVTEFDAVLFCLTLEHVADLAAPLREARRILRDGGSIHILEIHPFCSLQGVAAHFQDSSGLVHMPTFPHQFAEYLNTFAELGLAVAGCREWRPGDLGTALPAKLLKRGAEFPMLVEFTLVKGR